MFGHVSLPSRIYSYGARVPHGLKHNPPFEGFQRVEEQMRLAHQYRNKLVEIELGRRKQVDEALLRLSPALVEVEKKIAGEDARLGAARDLILQASAEARKKVIPKEAADLVKAYRESLKALRGQRKELRKALFASPEWKIEQEKSDTWAETERKRLRAESGLFWGSYLHVEQSMSGIRSGAPPKFHRWEGDGHLAVQLQGGLSIPDAFSCKDTRIRIEPVPEEAWLKCPKELTPEEAKKQGRKLRKTKVWFRTGSDKNGAPIWAVIPIVLHRPMPSDAQIKWAHFIRRRIGTHCEWQVHFVLARAQGWARPDCAKDGSVGIDVGWRMRPDESLRVAFWKGSDGKEDELVLPADWLGEMARVRRIQSHRDVMFDEIRPLFATWLNANTVPDWLKEACGTLPQWKSQARLAAVVIRWREARFQGDEEQFQALEAWRKRDKHLLEFGANLRDQLQGRREHIYRNFAAQMRRAYKTAFIENLDLRDFHVLPEAEEASPDGALREHVRDACLSLLLQCIKESMTETIAVPAKDTTRKCNACGSIEIWDHKILEHTCSKCGVKADQDKNASENILGGESKPEPKKTKCPSCGSPEELDPKVIHQACSKCGNKLEEGGAPESATETAA